MTKKLGYVLSTAVSLFIGLVVGIIIAFCCKGCTSNTMPSTTIIRTDTVVVVQRDTLREVRRIEQVKHHYDTIRVNDTVYIKDEPQTYMDSTEKYRLSIEAVKLYGYELDLYRADTVRIVETTTQETPKRKGRWGQAVVVGLQVGYGFTPGLKPEPYVGVGITYGFGYTW